MTRGRWGCALHLRVTTIYRSILGTSRLMGRRLVPVGELARDRSRMSGQGLLRTTLRGGRPPLSLEERRRRARDRKRRWRARNESHDGGADAGT